jgi:hypothetical protein
MEKTTPFKKRKKDSIKVDSFNRQKFINEFVDVLKNTNLTTEQKTQILYNHCLYNKNSPLKINKG